MPIFRYTLKKILISPSTWVVFTLTLLILGLGWILVPITISSNFPAGFKWTPEIIKSSFLVIWKQMAFLGLIGLMLFIFLGIKSVQIFRDEIDDGTLLILVSKPISRNRIWLEKWLTFQVTIIGYIFLSIFIPSLFLLLPVIAGPTYFITLFPYMWILFGIALLFDLIFSSVALLISLVLNSKATIALMIGFAALINIFSTVVDHTVIVIPTNYFIVSQAVKTYQVVEKKLDANDLTWFNNQQKLYVTDDSYRQAYNDLIDALMKKVYDNLIFNGTGKTYPDNYDPSQEKIQLARVADGTAGPTFTISDQDLAKRIIDISNVYRQWDAQSYEEIMTGTWVGHDTDPNKQVGKNTVEYKVTNTFIGLKPLDKSIVDNLNNKVRQKRVFRYFNIFYQLSYLFNGIINEQNSLFSSPNTYQQSDDPYLISFNETAVGSGQYAPNPDASSNGKIINFPALITMYLLVGTALLGASWYIFNRRDFA